MSEGVEPTKASTKLDASNPADLRPEEPQADVAPASAHLSAKQLTPPPVPRLKRALKANLLPPPPGVKSRYNPLPTPPRASSPQTAVEQGLGIPENIEVQPSQPLTPELAATQVPGVQETTQPQVGPAQPQNEELLAQPPRVASDDDSATPSQDEASQSSARAPNPRAAFQGANLNPVAESKSYKKPMFALLGLLLLGVLSWWQLRGANSPTHQDPSTDTTNP